MGGRAAIYARFSSHNQRGESIEIQVEKSRAYCAENDLRVVATYCDFAQTGTNTDRAEFQRMMADAKRGLFDFVVIYKVTRIMRNRDEMAMARIMLRRCRVEILYAGEDISDGSAGVLQLGMLEVLAEYESALDGERIRDGIQKNAERCMANGCVRYGWDIVDGRYVVNEEEAAAIRLGVRMVLSGKSVADVVRAWEPYRTKRGGKWRFQTVRRILMRRENGGEYRYAGVVVPGGMPAIVPMDDEERVIRMLEDSHRPRAKTEAWDFPLTGKLYDGRDGGLMTGTSGTGKSGRPYHYYRCRSCGRTVRRDAVEKRVADAVREALGSADSRERIAHDAYLYLLFHPNGCDLLGHIAAFLRPGEVTYESLESAASQWGFISQIPLGRISCVTTGAEGLVDTRFGAIEFVHTNDGLNDVKRGILDRMPRNRLPIATEERCLHDLVSRKRSLELIDWDEVDAD